MSETEATIKVISRVATETTAEKFQKTVLETTDGK
jgi:hypothetical protein